MSVPDTVWLCFGMSLSRDDSPDVLAIYRSEEEAKAWWDEKQVGKRLFDSFWCEPKEVMP